jgi:hypothetical protein
VDGPGIVQVPVDLQAESATQFELVIVVEQKAPANPLGQQYVVDDVAGAEDAEVAGKVQLPPDLQVESTTQLLPFVVEHVAIPDELGQQ